jgi:hypothetical protein
MEQSSNKNFKDVITSDFSKGVHEYLSHYVDVADTKAGVLIGLASALLGFIFTQTNYQCSHFLLMAILLEIFAVGISVYAVLPRLYTGHKGYIFWEDILTWSSPKSYTLQVSDLTRENIEEDYAQQNYYLSKILNRKFSAIRWGMLSFIVGAIFISLFILF